MSTQTQMFNSAVDRLHTIFKDDSAKLEAIDLTAKIALEAFGDIAGLSGPIGTTSIRTTPYHQTKFAPSEVKKEAPVELDPRAAETAQEAMLKWAKGDPVACQRWINKTLKGVIERAAQAKFTNTMDEGGWQSAWMKALAGNEASDDIALKRAQESAKAAEEKLAADKAKAEEDAEREANIEEAKRKEKEWKENQKVLGKEYKAQQKAAADEARRQKHLDALENMDIQDLIYNMARSRHQAEGTDPNAFDSTKDRSFLTNKLRDLRRWWHKKRADLNCAMGNNDTAVIESIKADLLQFKTFCESYGYTVDEVLMG